MPSSTANPPLKFSPHLSCENIPPNSFHHTPHTLLTPMTCNRHHYALAHRCTNGHHASWAPDCSFRCWRLVLAPFLSEFCFGWASSSNPQPCAWLSPSSFVDKSNQGLSDYLTFVFTSNFISIKLD